MNEYTYGTCGHCGQTVAVGGGFSSEEEADRAAVLACDCPKAKIEQRISQRIEEARDRVRELFGAEAEDLGFRPIEEREPVALLDSIVELAARGVISSATIKIRGYCQAKVSLTAKGKIKIERSENRSCNLEVEE